MDESIHAFLIVVLAVMVGMVALGIVDGFIGATPSTA